AFILGGIFGFIGGAIGGAFSNLAGDSVPAFASFTNAVKQILKGNNDLDLVELVAAALTGVILSPVLTKFRIEDKLARAFFGAIGALFAKNVLPPGDVNSARDWIREHIIELFPWLGP